MDVNVKGLEPEIAERLARQAAAEGVSQQEWIRQLLRLAAGRLSPAELMAQRGAISPMTEADFDKIKASSTRRRHGRVESLGAKQRGR